MSMLSLKLERPGLVRDLLRLLSRWWRVDRVRVSPTEGRLLRLEPPCILRIGDRVLEVVRRKVGQTPDGAYVEYDCDDGASRCALRVFPVGLTQQPRVHMLCDARLTVLAAADIDVYG